MRFGKAKTDFLSDDQMAMVTRSLVGSRDGQERRKGPNVYD